MKIRKLAKLTAELTRIYHDQYFTAVSSSGFLFFIDKKTLAIAAGVNINNGLKILRNRLGGTNAVVIYLQKQLRSATVEDTMMVLDARRQTVLLDKEAEAYVNNDSEGGISPRFLN